MAAWPAVTVIVAVFNGERTIGPCLDALLALDYPADRREIIVVDNDSTDGTRAILARYGSAIRIDSEPVRGKPAACNRAAALASHPILANTDADCVVDRDWLAPLVRPLEDPAVGMVGGQIRALCPDDPIQAFGERVHDQEAAIGARLPYVIGMSWACRRPVFEAVGRFDLRFLRQQDSDLAFRIHQAGYRLVYAPESLVRHHNRDTLQSLYGEGYKHGHWSVLWTQKHARALAPLGRPRIAWWAYRDLARLGVRSVLGPRGERQRTRHEFVFKLGKRVGKLTGSYRFRHLEV